MGEHPSWEVGGKNSPLLPFPSGWALPEPTHLLVVGDKGEGLVQGQGSHCSGLWWHRAWPMP